MVPTSRDAFSSLANSCRKRTPRSGAATRRPEGLRRDSTADHRLTINHQDVAISEAEERFRTLFEARREKTLFVIGAPAVRYGEIMRVIDAAMGAGVTKVGIVTEGMRQEATGIR